MATLRNKRNLAAVTRETQEENPRNGQSRNTSVPRNNEEYITQVSEQIEGRVTKNLSQEFSRTESRILGALSKLDEFLLNQQITTHSGTVPGTIRNTNVENRGTNEDDSQSDPHPEAGIFRGQTTQNLGPKDCRDNIMFDDLIVNDVIFIRLLPHVMGNHDMSLAGSLGHFHPFHIHQHQFKLLSLKNSIGDDVQSSFGFHVGDWYDVIAVKGEAKIGFTLREIPGLVLFHCHVAPHSDKGMAGLMRIRSEKETVAWIQNFVPELKDFPALVYLIFFRKINKLRFPQSL